MQALNMTQGWAAAETDMEATVHSDRHAVLHGTDTFEIGLPDVAQMQRQWQAVVPRGAGPGSLRMEPLLQARALQGRWQLFAAIGDRANSVLSPCTNQRSLGLCAKTAPFFA